MTRDTTMTMIVGLTLVLGGVAVVDQRWDAIEKENNAFAKDCNDRGGVVIFGMNARQCIGAMPTKETK